MPSPDTSLATLRPDLSDSFMEFDLEMQDRGYIASQVFPVIEVASQAGTFGKIPIEQLLQNRDTARAPGSGYSRGTFKFTKASYACQEEGAEEIIDDREARMYRNYFDAEMLATARAFEAVLTNAEKRVADMIFNAANFTPTSVTNEWDDGANATPLADVEAAVQRLYNRTGIWPNALIINRLVFRNLRNCNEIIDRVKHQGFVDVRAGEITRAQLASAFDLDNIIVAGSSKNTANEGASASISPVWSSEYAMIAKIATSNDMKEPCLGRTFHWDDDGSLVDGRVETYRDETVRGNATRVRHDVDEVLLYAEAGELLDNITT